MIDANTIPITCPFCGTRASSHTSVPLHYFCPNEKCEIYMVHIWHKKWNRLLEQLEKTTGRWNGDSGSYDVISFMDVEKMLRSS